MLGAIIGAALGLGGGTPVTVESTKGLNTLKLNNGLIIRRTSAAVSGAAAMQLPGSSTQIATWSERVNGRTQPYYAISLDGTNVEQMTAADYSIKIRYQEFDPAKRAPIVPADLKANANNRMHIVQFHTQPLEEMRQEIEAAGGSIRTYLPMHSYIIDLPEGSLESVRSMAFVRAVVPFEPAYRLEGWVLDRLQNGSLGTMRYNIQLFEKGEAAMGRVVSTIQMIGGTIDNEVPTTNFMTATLSPSQLRHVLQLNEVAFVDRWSAPQPDMNNIRVVSGINNVNSISPFGAFTGVGLKGAVMDGGLRTSHQAFLTGRVEVQGAVGVDSHGTATYGINFGNGAGNANGMGMLPNAIGVIAAYSAFLNGAGDRNGLTADLVNRGAVYQSNSWGDAQTTVYTTVSAQMDTILMNNDIVILNSQSNTGNQTSRPQAWSKNVVSIGGAFHFDNANTADDRYNGTGTDASVGPAADGRMKPELTNAYDAQLTTTSTNDTAYTTSFGGTSGATPITAGNFGVMFEMWGRGIFGNACTGATHHANRPKASVAKGIMINTAIPYPMVAPFDFTRARQGWGRVDVNNLFGMRDKFFVVNETDSLNNLGTKTYKVWIPQGENFRATMVYKDPGATSSATLHRINNLNLKVTSPSGTIYWGNNGMTGASTSLVSTSGGVADNINTVENVFVNAVSAPESGAWTIEVIGADINTDVDPTTAGTNARFGLVVTGATHSIPASSFVAGGGSLQSGNLASLTYSDNSRMNLGEITTEDLAGNYRYLVVSGTVPGTTCSKLDLLTEFSTGLPAGTASVDFFDWNLGDWVTVNTVTGGALTNDYAMLSSASGNQYVKPGTREVAARLRVSDTDLSAEVAWSLLVDLVRFQYQP